MNNRPLQPGDLCLIVGARISHHNIGKAVELLHHIPAGGKIHSFDGHLWKCTTGEECWIVSGVDSCTGIRNRAMFARRNLMRISGNPDSEILHEQQDLIHTV